MLAQPGRVLVCIGADLSTQSQRCAVEIADRLRATVETPTSETATAGLLAAQHRGRATATLGEIRNRADVLLFWGTDPTRRYPRFHTRYAPEPAGIQLTNGRADRFVIGVHVGRDKAPAYADASVTLEPDEEIAALSLMRAAVSGHSAASAAARPRAAVDLIPRLSSARYAVLIHDAEPTAEPRNPLRVEGLIALAQALNGPTRAALLSLRAGGNQPGAESALTWQTGFPVGVDYSRSYPRYAPELGKSARWYGSFDTALIVGSPTLDDGAVSALERVATIAIGPRASQSSLNPKVAIDTGVAGIHEGGVGYRMDDVPLPLRPSLPAQRSTVEILTALCGAIRQQAGST
jgi:formylmethanofuran dehydrogenase subunit B